MTALALDLGKHIGWVKGAAVGPMEYGSYLLDETTDLGRWLQSSDAFLQEVLPGTTSIAIEQPYMGDNKWVMQKLSALLGHIAYYGRFQGIGWAQIKMIANSTGKKRLAGHGHSDKDQMIAAAVAFGLDDPDEHTADALGIWMVHMFGPSLKPPPRRVRSSKVTVISP